VETRAEHILAVLKAGSVSTNVYLRRLHNFALDTNWLLAPTLVKRKWPAPGYRKRRAITRDEHQRIVARENRCPVHKLLKRHSASRERMFKHLSEFKSLPGIPATSGIDWQCLRISSQKPTHINVGLLRDLLGQLLA
jgi:hypothetical protein